MIGRLLPTDAPLNDLVVGGTGDELVVGLPDDRVDHVLVLSARRNQVEIRPTNDSPLAELARIATRNQQLHPIGRKLHILDLPHFQIVMGDFGKRRPGSNRNGVLRSDHQAVT